MRRFEFRVWKFGVYIPMENRKKLTSIAPVATKQLNNHVFSLRPRDFSSASFVAVTSVSGFIQGLTSLLDMDVADVVVKPLVSFAKDSYRLVKRCTKPDWKGECPAALTT